MKNEIRFTLEPKQRPKLAQEIGNILGTALHYEWVPSCVYDIAGYRMDKEGVLYIPDVFCKHKLPFRVMWNLLKKCQCNKTISQ